MYITATNLSMDASQTYKEVEQRFSGLANITTSGAWQSDSFGIRLTSVLASSNNTQINCHSEICRTDGTSPVSTKAGTSNQHKTVLLEQMTEQVTGQSVSIRTLQDSLLPGSVGQSPQQNSSSTINPESILFTSGTVYSQSSSLLFSAKGSVQTSDGCEIGFDLGLSLEQNTVAATTSSLASTGIFTDPLVLQFDPNTPLLSDTSFLFDINSDGGLEELACPGSGCGFLAFDRNGDGVINNGSELFGPDSGSGFGELAKLDSDTNLWIDENDPLFTQLLIWSRDETGEEKLCSIKEAGVGAIALTHAGTSFQLRQKDGTVSAMIGAEGIFLTEDGEVRPMHEVDLNISEGRNSEESPNEIDVFGTQASQRHAALHLLQNIIAMQRLRLKIMLTSQRLHRITRGTSQQHQFFEWLQQQNQHHNDIKAQLADNLANRITGSDPSHV